MPLTWDKLNNGIPIFLNSGNELFSMSVVLCNVGFSNIFDKPSGISHLVEHLICRDIDGKTKTNAFTLEYATCYTDIGPSLSQVLDTHKRWFFIAGEYIVDCLEKLITPKRVRDAIAEVNNEYYFRMHTALIDVNQYSLYNGNGIYPGGQNENLKITGIVNKCREFIKKTYGISNMRIIIEYNEKKTNKEDVFVEINKIFGTIQYDVKTNPEIKLSYWNLISLRPSIRHTNISNLIIHIPFSDLFSVGDLACLSRYLAGFNKGFVSAGFGALFDYHYPLRTLGLLSCTLYTHGNLLAIASYFYHYFQFLYKEIDNLVNFANQSPAPQLTVLYLQYGQYVEFNKGIKTPTRKSLKALLNTIIKNYSSYTTLVLNYLDKTPHKTKIDETGTIIGYSHFDATGYAPISNRFEHPIFEIDDSLSYIPQPCKFHFSNGGSINIFPIPRYSSVLEFKYYYQFSYPALIMFYIRKKKLEEMYPTLNIRIIANIFYCTLTITGQGFFNQIPTIVASLQSKIELTVVDLKSESFHQTVCDVIFRNLFKYFPSNTNLNRLSSGWLTVDISGHVNSNHLITLGSFIESFTGKNIEFPVPILSNKIIYEHTPYKFLIIAATKELDGTNLMKVKDSGLYYAKYTHLYKNHYIYIFPTVTPTLLVNQIIKKIDGKWIAIVSDKPT